MHDTIAKDRLSHHSWFVWFYRTTDSILYLASRPCKPIKMDLNLSPRP